MNPPDGKPPGFVEIPLWGSAAVGFRPIVPGMKQVRRPLLAIRISAGQGPLDNFAPGLAPSNSTANNLPAAFPATPVVIPGMSYATKKGCLSCADFVAQELALVSC